MRSEYNLLQSVLGIKYKILARVTKDSISLAVSGKPDVVLQWKDGSRVYSWAKKNDRTSEDVEIHIAMLREATRLAAILEKHSPELKTTHEDLMEKLDTWIETKNKKPRLLSRGPFRKV